jgi:hypothetical protein
MQRQTLVPVAQFMEGRDPMTVKALEVACGTGRFATFFKVRFSTNRDRVCHSGRYAKNRGGASDDGCDLRR